MNEFEKLLNKIRTETKWDYEVFTNCVGMRQINLLDQDGEKVDDVIFGEGSHGYEEGLLETYNLGDCEGYETADQVFEGWKKMIENA